MDFNGTSFENEAEAPDLSQIPICDDSLKPRVGLYFSTFDEGYMFYRTYGKACGFSVRKSTIKRARDNTILYRYVLCTRAGKKKSTSDEEGVVHVARKRKRKTSSCRVGCTAKVCFRFEDGVACVISKFFEVHNHKFASAGYHHLMKINRNIHCGHQIFIAKCAKANVGAAKAFRIYKELAGGFEKVGCRKMDFKNMSRDLKAHAEGTDVQLLVTKFSRMCEKNDSFFYSYSVDEESNLTRLFWADPTSMQNYQIFGDVVSLDATYSTNRYSMIFAPFTGRDNHGRCVNFGAGILSHEDCESYSWLLLNFVKCMGSSPKMLITDQDLGLKAAIEKVLPDTRHRYCMWHIMMKLIQKCPGNLRDNVDFFQKFNDMVWSDLDEPHEFEAKWIDIMSEYDLNGHKWFDDMYELRTFWIPAYFREVNMSGLFRTTSLSESENSLFRRFFNRNANLSEFYMLFETALEGQRDDHDALTLNDETSSPELVTQLEMEKHAVLLYTNKIFLEVQKEINAALMFCTIPKTFSEVGEIIYDVDEDAVGIFKVKFNISDDVLSCACNYFVRKGMICRHMFFVMRHMKYKSVPEKYIARRWTKGACSVFDVVGQNRYASGDNNKSASTSDVFSLACKCVGLAEGNEEITNGLTAVLSDFFNKYVNTTGPSSSLAVKQKLIEQYYGDSVPAVVTVNPPKIAKTKGSCSRKKSRMEAEIEKAKKPLRLCRKCNTMGHHDSRNCPTKSKS